MSGKFAANPYYIECEDRLKELARLMAEGKGDTPDADAVREAMEHPYRLLAREERERLNGLSADLYMLEDAETFEPLGPNEENEDRAPERLRSQLRVAWESDDAPEVLALLRKGTAGFPEPARAYLRARAYEALGHLDTALLFLRYAADKDAGNAGYRFMILAVLDTLGRREDQIEMARSVIEQGGSPPELIVQAAGVLFGSTRGMTQEQARPLCEMAISAVQPALGMLKDESGPMVRRFRAFGQLTLGMCYRRLDRIDDARQALNEAVRPPEFRDAALVVRGMLLIESDPPAALSDFQLAAESDVSAIAPYIYLAHNALTEEDYVRSLEMCTRGLGKTKNPRIQAVLWQWIALALFETMGLTEEVHNAFASAIALDPLNLQIRHNYDLVQHVERARAGGPRPPVAWQLSVPSDIEGGEGMLPSLPAAA